MDSQNPDRKGTVRHKIETADFTGTTDPRRQTTRGGPKLGPNFTGMAIKQENSHPEATTHPRGLASPSSYIDSKAAAADVVTDAEDEDEHVSTVPRKQGAPPPSKQGLPKVLASMWTRIDPELSPGVRASIITETFSDYDPTKDLSEQSWMTPGGKRTIVALEKARIANDGKVPADWKSAASYTVFGPKWLGVTEQREREEEAARVREEKKAREAEAKQRQALQDLNKARDELERAQTSVFDAEYLEFDRLRAVGKAKKALADAESLAQDAHATLKVRRDALEWAAEKATAATKQHDEIVKQTQQAREQAAARKRKAEDDPAPGARRGISKLEPSKRSKHTSLKPSSKDDRLCDDLSCGDDSEGDAEELVNIWWTH